VSPGANSSAFPEPQSHPLSPDADGDSFAAAAGLRSASQVHVSLLGRAGRGKSGRLVLPSADSALQLSPGSAGSAGAASSPHGGMFAALLDEKQQRQLQSPLQLQSDTDDPFAAAAAGAAVPLTIGSAAAIELAPIGAPARPLAAAAAAAACATEPAAADPPSTAVGVPAEEGDPGVRLQQTPPARTLSSSSPAGGTGHRMLLPPLAAHGAGAAGPAAAVATKDAPPLAASAFAADATSAGAAEADVDEA
jgi:hypothetical protein